MLVNYSKIVGAKIFDIKSQQMIGVVFELLAQKSDLSISGIVLKNNFFEFRTRVISSSDILEVSNNAVIVRDHESVVDINETVRLKESLQEGYYGIRQKIITKSGKFLGRVFDYAIESKSMSIVKLYVRSIISERIIPINMIISYSGKTIIVKDDVTLIKVIGRPATESSIV